MKILMFVIPDEIGDLTIDTALTWAAGQHHEHTDSGDCELSCTNHKECEDQARVMDLIAEQFRQEMS